MPRRRVPHNHLATERTVTSAPGNQHESAAAAEHAHGGHSTKAVQFSVDSARPHPRQRELRSIGCAPLCNVTRSKFEAVVQSLYKYNLHKVLSDWVRFLKERLEVVEI